MGTEAAENTTRKEMWDVGATVVGGVVALVMIAVEAFRLLRADGVPTIAGAVAGAAATDGGAGVSPGALSPVTTGFLWTVTGLHMVSLAVLAVLGSVVAARCMRGHFFDTVTIRILTATSWILLGYLLLTSFATTLGTNLALRDLDATHTDVNVFDYRWFVLTYLFLMFLSLITVAFRRAAAMRRDQEGLV